ncbi:hypothetical protein BC936DRAFT_146842 [Jimgerdemannia flammicorona]|uniref:WKF domain-containing protein n=1 Tax=Jimgerdemannia flammicorona TaxID=994334 RepID=A0A433D6N8_9FUNG|nr:hypothetical protein BC936DRAFT_146842 [Jimgerdemannia flammicorona]
MVTKQEKKYKSAKDPDPENPAKNPDPEKSVLPKPATTKRPKKKVDEDTDEKSKTSKADVEAAAESPDEEEERQVKRKKKAGKLAGLFDRNKNDTAVTESIIPVHPALEYLSTWKKARSSWKFQKVRQTWLLLHIYDEDKVSHGIDLNSFTLPREIDTLTSHAYESMPDSRGVLQNSPSQTIEKANEVHRATPSEDAEATDDDSLDDESAKAKAESKRHEDKKAERALEVLRVLS